VSAKLVPTTTDIGCRVLSATDPYCRILGFLDRILENTKIKIMLVSVLVKYGGTR
jgi:hypothetical protein